MKSEILTIQDKVNADLKAAILSSNADVKSILRVLIGEFNRVDKIVPDEKAVAIIRKMIENAKIVGNEKEATILEAYLPKQLTEDELSSAIVAIIFANNYTVKDMGAIMAALKLRYAGQYDGKIASSLIKAKLL